MPSGAVVHRHGQIVGQLINIICSHGRVLPPLFFDKQNVDKTFLYTKSVDKHRLDCNRIEHFLSITDTGD